MTLIALLSATIPLLIFLTLLYLINNEPGYKERLERHLDASERIKKKEKDAFERINKKEKL